MELPQVLGAKECLPCEVCCRFPDPRSPFRPVFRAEEIRALIDAGESETAWGSSASDPAAPVAARVQTLADRAGGDGHHCPFLDEATHACRIYARRPLDCQLYPLMLVLSPAGDEAFLHLDSHCPFTARYLEHSATIPRVAAFIEEHADSLAADFLIVADEVATPRVVARLPRLSAALGLSHGWRRLRRGDRPLVEVANAQGAGDEVADFARGFVPLYLHRSRHDVLFKPVGDHLLVLARSQGSAWVPVAPLGPALSPQVVSELAEELTRLGGGTTLHLPALRPEDLPTLRDAGFTIRCESHRVVARRSEVADPQGKSRRALRNLIHQGERSLVSVRPLEPGDIRGVLELWQAWYAVRVGPGDAASHLMAHDARAALLVALEEAEALALVALVACAGEDIVGFTAAASLDARTAVVLFEFAHPRTRGVAQLLARELARATAGHEWLDLMDTHGRIGVARAKARYGSAVDVLGALRRAPSTLEPMETPR